MLFVSACLGTETGNPPVINGLLVHALRVGSEVAVDGAPGAVLPGGSTLFITDTHGFTLSVTTERDGSFHTRLSADGTLSLRAANGAGVSDELPVTPDGPIDSDPPQPPIRDSGTPAPVATDAGVSALSDANAGASALSDANSPTATGASDGGVSGDLAASNLARTDAQTSLDRRSPVSLMTADAEAFACDQASQAASVLTRAVDEADRSCAVAADCVSLRAVATTSCQTFCTSSVASLAGRATVQAAADAAQQQYCGLDAVLTCSTTTAPCAPSTGVPACVANVCTTAP